jgi:hypothetical protein
MMGTSYDWWIAVLALLILPLTLASCGDDPLAAREEVAGAQTQTKGPSGAQVEDSELLYACYRPNSGGVYRINAPETPGAEPRLKDDCTSAVHVMFSWNEKGPKGDRGEKGEKGDKGDSGSITCRMPVGPASGTAVGDITGRGLAGRRNPDAPLAELTGVDAAPAVSALGPEPFIGEVILFAGNFAPRGWAFAEGQLLAIPQNTALFSIIGTTYGGDGRVTFALPDTRGLEPVCGMHYIIALVGVFPSRN